MSQIAEVKTVLFDLGYTLVFFDGDFAQKTSESYSVLARVLNREGCHLDVVRFSERFQDLITQYYQDREKDLIERPVEDLVRKALKEAGQDHVPAEKIRLAMDEMYAITEQQWKIENDAHSTLKELINRGFHLGVVSNAADAVDVSRIIDQHKLRDYFEVIIVSADFGIRKPDPRLFKIALQRMHAKPQSAVMVGDNLRSDILGAHRAGMRAIWITRRSDDPHNAQLRSSITPDAEVSSLEEVSLLLDQWNQSLTRAGKA